MNFLILNNQIEIDQNGLCNCSLSQFEIHSKNQCSGAKN